jgi:hypothetical protein
MKARCDPCIFERYSLGIRRLVPGVEAKLTEKLGTTFRDFVLRQIKRAALNNCWLHIDFPLTGWCREKRPHQRGRLTLRLLETQHTVQTWISELYLPKTNSMIQSSQEKASDDPAATGAANAVGSQFCITKVHRIERGWLQLHERS